MLFRDACESRIEADPQRICGVPRVDNLIQNVDVDPQIIASRAQDLNRRREVGLECYVDLLLHLLEAGHKVDLGGLYGQIAFVRLITVVDDDVFESLSAKHELGTGQFLSFLQDIHFEAQMNLLEGLDHEADGLAASYPADRLEWVPEPGEIAIGRRAMPDGLHGPSIPV